MIIKKSVLAASVGVAVAWMSFTSQAEITILKQDTQAGDLKTISMLPVL